MKLRFAVVGRKNDFLIGVVETKGEHPLPMVCKMAVDALNGGEICALDEYKPVELDSSDADFDVYDATDIYRKDSVIDALMVRAQQHLGAVAIGRSMKAVDRAIEAQRATKKLEIPPGAPLRQSDKDGALSYKIPVTQFHLPDGRRTEETFVTDDAVLSAAAMAIIKHGWKFEAEVLRTGQISLTVADPVKEIDVDIEVCPNGPEVSNAFAKLVARVYAGLDLSRFSKLSGFSK